MSNGKKQEKKKEMCERKIENGTMEEREEKKIRSVMYYPHITRLSSREIWLYTFAIFWGLS